MKFIAGLGWVLACMASPSNAVVVIEPTAIAVQRPAAPGAAAADARSFPASDANQMALVIPALIIAIGVFSIGKQRSPRSVVA